MRLEGNCSLSEQAILKDLKILINVREYFKYSESNSLKELIPE